MTNLHTLPASEETVPAMDAKKSASDKLIAELEKQIEFGGVQNAHILLALIARIRSEREQAVRECAEIAREIATDVRNSSEARFQAGVLATRILSLSQVSAKK